MKSTYFADPGKASGPHGDQVQVSIGVYQGQLAVGDSPDEVQGETDDVLLVSVGLSLGYGLLRRYLQNVEH